MSPRTLERWRWLGKGPTYVRIAHVLYRLEDVMAFAAAQLVDAGSINRHSLPTSDVVRPAAVVAGGSAK
jgi:hypothetical protein